MFTEERARREGTAIGGHAAIGGGHGRAGMMGGAPAEGGPVRHEKLRSDPEQGQERRRDQKEMER